MRCVLVLGLFAAGALQAETLFTDNLNSYSTLSSDPNWATDGSAQLVADPLNPSNNVIDFTADSSGGDLFSQFIPYTVGQPLLLSFSFLELNPGDPGANPAAYVGTDHTDALPETANEQWLLSTLGAAYPELGQANITYGVWNQIDLEFVPYDPDDDGSFSLKLEQVFDGNSADGRPGTAFFDDIELQTVPEPVPASQVLGGLAMLALIYRSRAKARKR